MADSKTEQKPKKVPAAKDGAAVVAPKTDVAKKPGLGRKQRNALKMKEKRGPKTVKKGLPVVPESVLKRRKKRQEGKLKTIKSKLEKRQAARKKRVQIFKRAENYVREYRRKERDQIRLSRLARKSGNFYVPPEPKLAFVIRIRGINKVHPRVRKTLQLFRLRQINNGVFVKLNKATVNMLRVVEPYVAWGYPNLKTIRDMIYKRGYMKIDKRRTPIMSNTIIEKYLAKQNIICIEDLVHEIFTVGKNFRKATNILWPFKLKTPTGGWRKKANHYVEGGDYGNREGKINELLERMI